MSTSDTTQRNLQQRVSEFPLFLFLLGLIHPLFVQLSRFYWTSLMVFDQNVLYDGYQVDFHGTLEQFKEGTAQCWYYVFI